MLGRCLTAFAVWVAVLVACNSLTAGPGSACMSAGGACLVNSPTSCVAQAPPSAQDCNTSSAPNPGGLVCCLIFVDSGDGGTMVMPDASEAGDAADAFDGEDAEDAQDAEDAADAEDAGGDATDAEEAGAGGDGDGAALAAPDH